MVDRAHIKKIIKEKMPFAVGFYRRVRNVSRRLSLLLPLEIRLQRGMGLTLKDKKRIIHRIYLQREEMPFFSGKRVLCWEPAPWPVHVAFTSSIGAALALRGCYVEQVICDGTPVACIGREIVNNESFSDWRKRCPGCYKACEDEANSFGLRTVAMGGIVDADKVLELRRISQKVDLKDEPSCVYKGVDVGKYANSSFVRYYQGKANGLDEELFQEYLFSALVILEAAITKIDSFCPDVVYMSHALYTTWGPAWEIAIKRGIPVVRIGGGYRKGFIYFRKIKDLDTVGMGALSDRGWKERREKVLSPYEERALDSYFTERYGLDSDGFSDVGATTSVERKHDILGKLGITDDKPIWCVFTHLSWDDSVGLSGSVAPMAFYGYKEWTEETLRMIADIRDVQWLIRIHPKEKWGGKVGWVEKTINDMFPNLPPHIKVIAPEASINTRSIFDVMTGAVTCRGTVGLEVPAIVGKPVILAAGAYYSGKGFTYDGLAPNEYRKLLRKTPEIPPFLTPEQRERARRFAYSYYIQRQVPLRMFRVGSNGRFVSFDWRRVESLLPGRDPVVDMICERFFKGDDFVLPNDIVHSMYDYAVEPEVLP